MEARAELAAMEAALNGSPVAPEHTRLAEFACELRATRPRPREGFVKTLDARACEGFRRNTDLRPDAAHNRANPRPRRAARPVRVPRKPRLARPAVGAALALLLATAVAVPFALSGSRHVAATPNSAEVRSAPAVPAPRSSATSAAPSVPLGQQAAPAAPNSGSAAGASQNRADSRPRQVERTATLDVGVAPGSIQSASQQVFTLVSGFGGYVRQSNVSSGVGGGGASFDVRVPSANLSVAIEALSHLGHVRSENDATKDVTDQFNSLAGSLGDARAERASVLKQLREATEPQQEEALKVRLHALEARISQAERELATLRARVNYTSVALTLTAEAPVGAKHSDLTPGGAARDAGQILEAAFAVVVLVAAAAIPVAAVALALWAAFASSRRRLREHALDAS
jgi:hypothetical protein